MNERRKKIVERYDDLYSKETPFGTEADLIVRDIPSPLVGEALELGAGQGRNSFALAARGLRVRAIEISPKGVEIIKKHAAEQNLSVEASVGDITELEWNQKYDVVVSTFVLHFLTREDAMRVIGEMQSHTNIGGLNALALFTQDGDFFRKDPATTSFYPASDELKNLYRGWEVLKYSEEEAPSYKKNEDGTPTRNTVARILAKRIL